MMGVPVGRMLAGFGGGRASTAGGELDASMVRARVTGAVPDINPELSLEQIKDINHLLQ